MAKRDKQCVRCTKKPNVLFRIRYRVHEKAWVFACKECVLLLKKNNPHYQYGGTWKR